MKKFLKAVALATVMCMLLSVSAFAAEVVDGVTVNTLEPAKATDSIELEVVAAKGEEVALLVVDSEAVLAELDDSEIEYIGQVTANAETGVADFGSFTVKNANAKVDIYVGSASFATAKKIGEDIDLNDVKEITIVTDGKYFKNVTGEAGVKGGVAAALTVDLDGLSVSKMIWAFKIGENEWKYSNVVDTAALNGSTLEGATQYAVALDSFKADMTKIEVLDVAAIFLTGEVSADNTHYVADTEASANAIKANGPYANNN